MSIQKRIREKRRDARLNQAEVAKALNIGLRTYNAKESGDSEFTASQIAELAKILNTTSEYLLGAEEPSRANTLMDETALQALVTKTIQSMVKGGAIRTNSPVDPSKIKAEINNLVATTRREDLPRLLEHVKSFRKG